uniref:Uncharacterized protein n=1 Tax=Cacopsylla melanoneura TaxID=428564 RepID=A0A8D8V0A5_9HEMI
MTFNLRVLRYLGLRSPALLVRIFNHLFVDFCVVYKERKVNYLRYEESFVHNKIPRFVLFLISPAHKWHTQSIPFILYVSFRIKVKKKRLLYKMNLLCTRY